MKYDFGGWASKYNVLCADGTTIKPGCFAEQNGETVPLVWNHMHDSASNVIGHADLEYRPEGVYAHCSFNDTDGGKTAKELVQHNDVCALSIWANHLRRKGGDIFHGIIREVSLVLAGADPGATIDTIISHGEASDDEAIISFISPVSDLVIAHADDSDEDDTKDSEEGEDMGDNDETVKDVLESLSDKQKKAVGILIDQVIQHSDDKDEESNTKDDSDETVQDVYNTLTDKQKKVVDFLVGTALEDKSNKGESDNMKHNVFEGDNDKSFISHSDEVEIFKEAKKLGSLKAAVDESLESGALAHADYGINDIDYLFPDAKTINTTPDFIKRDTSWVDGVMSETHHTPFSRVKSIFADITEDEARARGYIKGNLKKEEVFSLLKRTTDPQTIYKKQKLDKDDIDDITDFNVVAWIKAEMQMMLREETARAILIGDGRLASSDDKIKEDHIRPVYNDADLYTIKYPVEIAANATEDDKAKALIRAIIKSRKLYKGSGNPSFYTTDDELTNMLLLENSIGERLYKTDDEVRTAIRASKIVTVEPMEGCTIEVTEGSTKKTYPVAGVSVNLSDYNIGTNGGAKTDFFDDFDIDYNQYKYLYETRMSGALIKPYSAITYFYKTKTTTSTGSGS